MAPPRVERRLAAILAADVVGYSRLIGLDEQGTLERLKALRDEVVEPLLTEGGGRVASVAGDGFLAEFKSAVDAVRSAVSLQRTVAEREAALPDGGRLRLRIGINLGDVIVDGGEVYGDGVNVAARLEALAEPGGVWISRAIHEQVRGRLPSRFEPIGPKRLKNIVERVEVWRLAAGGAAPGGRGSAGPDPSGAEAPRLSIVVLPFANLGADPEQDYFAEGITDDLTTDLSRVDGSFVISRHTAFTYKARPGIDLREVGRELGVRYALEGSVRRTGDRVVINAQLIDAASGAHLWAERFEGPRDDLPSLHDRVTGRVAGTLRLELVRAEARRAERGAPRPDPDAQDDAIRGWALLQRAFSRENREAARALFERAIATDPEVTEAFAGLAYVLVGNIVDGWGVADGERERAEALVRRALDREPNRAAAHYAHGMVLRSQGRLAEALGALETAIALDRNFARAYLQLGMTLLYLGRPEEAIEQAERARRLNPRDPNVASHLWLTGFAHLLLGRAEEAIECLERGRAANPRLYYVHLTLAAALDLAGRVADARQALAESLRLQPEFDTLARWRGDVPWHRHPTHLELRGGTVDVGLRRAGMPDA